jgi:hypothetical protein
VERFRLPSSNDTLRNIPDTPNDEVILRLGGTWELWPNWLLYHYTSQSTMLKILDSKSFWATHIRYLNDSSEFNYAFGILQEALEIVRSKSLSNPQRSFLDAVLQHITRIEEHNVYVVCFSEVPDLLSQWRGYSPNGSGVSLAFTTGDLRDLARGQGFRLERCLYDKQEQIQRLVDELHNFIGMIIDREDAPADERALILADDFATDIFLHIAAFFKHQAFSEEREWRLVLGGLPMLTDLNFRIAGSTVTPYIRFALVFEGESIALSGIVIGPTPHPELVESAMKMLIVKHGLREVRVQRSAIPFRTW